MRISSYSESCTGIVKWFGSVDEQSGQTESKCVIPNFLRTSVDRAAERLRFMSDKVRVLHWKLHTFR